ncbi:MAG: IS3 family transposase, partial [Nitrospinota bacterium]|nr:IS3 family transposase [Nitrospinota bacterium]
EYSSVTELIQGLKEYFYNNERPHQSLGEKTPFEVYSGVLGVSLVV